MKREEIMEMVKQSDLEFLLGDPWLMHDEFVAFAKLVAAKKQEDIIKAIERLGTWAHIEEVVNAIRAKGQA